jgi:hypothetical protein
MGYYRVIYEGYLEDEFDTKNEAIEQFIKSMEEDIDSGHSNIVVEEYNYELDKWE